MNLNKKLAVAVSGAVLLMAGQFALADSTTDIVDALVSKGVLTEEEGKLISKGAKSQKDSQPVIKEKDGAFSISSPNGKNSIQLTGRVHFDARDVIGKNAPGYSEQINTAYRDNPNTATLADQFELRRARIGVKGNFGKFEYEAVTNLVGSSANLIDTAFVNAAYSDAAQLKIGKFKQPFNLEEYGTSSNNIDFQERSYVNQVTPGKKIGFMLSGAPLTGFTYAGSVYQQNEFGELDSATTGKGFAGRVTYNFAEAFGNKDMVLHVGLAGFDTNYGISPTNTANTAKSPEQNTRGTIVQIGDENRALRPIFRAQIAGDNVGASPGVAGSYGYGTRSATDAEVQAYATGLEMAATYKNFKIQGEYTTQDYHAKHENTSNYVDLGLNAGYISALWMLTGESYADVYKKGAWGTIKPKEEFNLDSFTGLGAWEFGLRYDQFSVDDTQLAYGPGTNGAAAPSGNKSRFQGACSNQTNDNNTGLAGSTCGAKSYTAGIKWIINPNVRVMTNYTYTKFDNAFAPIDVTNAAADASASYKMPSEKVLMMRTQFAF
jgi:phosphate-selective porin OprO and OprP